MIFANKGIEFFSNLRKEKGSSLLSTHLIQKDQSQHIWRNPKFHLFRVQKLVAVRNSR